MPIERPYFALPTPPQDLDALMSADRTIVDRDPGVLAHYRKLFAVDADLFYGDKPEGFNVIRVTVISSGIQARQIREVPGIDLTHDGVVLEGDE